jgi:hypothetical protein
LIRWGRRCSKLWVAIVLPGLLLRGLIPLGFMPMFGPGLGVQLMLCEGYAPLPSMATAMSADISMDRPMDMPVEAPGPAGGGSPPHHDHSACPYGTSPAHAALSAWTDMPLSAQPAAPAQISAPQIDHFEITPRAQSPRGPPLEV